MYITTKDKGNRVDTPEGEIIFEMIGCEKNQGDALKHSVAHVVIPSGCSSLLHYHPEAEETYCILKGEGKIVVDGKEYPVKSGDTVFISPLEKHQNLLRCALLPGHLNVLSFCDLGRYLRV